MKKILLLLACTPMMMFGMNKKPMMLNKTPVSVIDKMNKEKSIQPVDKLLTMEQGHMTDWLNYKKAKYDATIEIMKKHLNELIDLKLKGVAELNAGMDLKTYMAEGINKWISMHEAQTKEWREFHEAQHTLAKDIDASHKKELALFKAELKECS